MEDVEKHYDLGVTNHFVTDNGLNPVMECLPAPLAGPRTMSAARSLTATAGRKNESTKI